jgi:hypothetical protein
MIETFTFLNDDVDIVRAFVNETHHLTNGVSSHFNKLHLYRHYFPDIKDRSKMTGFERVKEADSAVRAKLRTAGEGWLVESDNRASTGNTEPFLDLMSKRINALEGKSLIFYSGGLDSEFVIRLFEMCGKPFTPITCIWLYNNRPINGPDIVTAMDFYRSRSYTPIVKTLNIQEFWDSEELVEISQRLCDTSPQRCTYKKVSNICGEEYPNMNRIFAGEIRYVVSKR